MKPDARSKSRRSPVQLQTLVPAQKKRKLNNGDPAPTKDTILRVSRPVENADKVHDDIWRHIFRFSEPRVLLEARTLSKKKWELLQESAIWKESRENRFGSDMPALPTALTEMQYADLLVGRGCQNSKCDKSRAAKVYWAFMVRLCSDCMMQKTVQAADPQEIEHYKDYTDLISKDEQFLYGRTLRDLIPSAITDSGKYGRGREVDPITGSIWADDRGFRLHLRSDYAAIYAEFSQIRADGAQAVLDWARKKHNQVIEHMKEVTVLEKWEKHSLQPQHADTVRSRRKEFFLKKAAALEPPISEEVLLRMSAFHKALDSANPPTQRAWEILLSKLMPYRAQAEVALRHRRFINEGTGADQELNLFRRLHAHRRDRDQPEQLFVLDIAAKELRDLADTEVADADLVLLCLKNVYERFQKVATEAPRVLKYDGTTGPYELCLDDARMIVQQVIEDHVESHSPRGAIVYDNFLCIGCTRTDNQRRFSFERAFEHILQHHAILVGEGLEFYRFAKPYIAIDDDDKSVCRFPWYTVPWPRNLPLLPAHRKVDRHTKWEPDADVAYVQAARSGKMSAFAGRTPVEAPGIESHDFQSNLVFAAESLKPAKGLDAACLTKIIFRYALDRLSDSPLRPAHTDFVDAIPRMQAANPALTFKFRCAYCIREDKVFKSARQVKYAVPMDKLREHWELKHRVSVGTDGTPLEWTRDMMDLPSDREVWDRMLEADEKLRQEKEDVRRREEEVKKTVRKRPSLKGRVVLERELCVDVFARLYIVLKDQNEG